ncbi:hypothetical protein WCE04_20030, partial [Pseudomonas shirazica]
TIDCLLPACVQLLFLRFIQLRAELALDDRLVAQFVQAAPEATESMQGICPRGRPDSLLVVVRVLRHHCSICPAAPKDRP